MKNITVICRTVALFVGLLVAGFCVFMALTYMNFGGLI